MLAVQNKLSSVVLIISVVSLLTVILSVLKLLNVLPIDWAAAFAPMTLYACCGIPVLFVTGIIAVAAQQ